MLVEELARIKWRAYVMTQPGGCEWLSKFAKLNEKDVGPHKLAFPR